MSFWLFEKGHARFGIHEYIADELNCIIQSLNAYEFERHAGCKTKHPNNHIYFDNGKTIYAVVQELKNTPQEVLFDAIQNVTGSTINQKNFRIWKGDSYVVLDESLTRKCFCGYTDHFH